MIDVGDYVHHNPSKEDWVVAAVEGDRLYWMGYPFGGSALLSDCVLLVKATDEYHKRCLHDVAEAGDARPCILAKRRLEVL